MDQEWTRLRGCLSDTILMAISKLNFTNMTPVQAACIPVFIKNKDVAVEAVTGSGKTVAFVAPLMQMLMRRQTSLKKHEVGAVILTPTRELAFQINEVIGHFIQHIPSFTSCLFIGGANPLADINKFITQGGHIVIATPGRLEDLLERKEAKFNLAASLKSLEVLILDEADRLLDMGFEASINTILSYLPKLRRTGLFSATQTDEVQKLIRAGLRNPVQISVKEKPSKVGINQKTPSTLSNYYMLVGADEKFSQLAFFLQQRKKEKIMVFFSTCASVDYFSQCLQCVLKRHQVLSIHSKMKKKRNKIFSDFRSMKSGILICTDVMARGVDIPDVNWVIQFDPPSSASAFVHRCGRTARIGNAGSALIMLLPNEDAYINFIEINQKAPLDKMERSLHTTEMTTKLQTLAINDRAVYVKGMRAYVSFIQSYAKHECSMILRLKDLDFGRLAQGYGLLHIPKMPELKGKTITNFQPVEVDISTIPYLDKSREKFRQEKLQSGEFVQKNKRTRPPRSEAWSKQKEKKDKRRLKKELKSSKGAKRKLEESQADDNGNDDFGSDLRLMKKLKKGKISKEEFDSAFGADVSD